MSRKLKVGIIGANWTLSAHVPAWPMLPDVEVGAICTSREKTTRSASAESKIERLDWDPC